MITLLLTIILAAIIIGGICAMILIIFGLTSLAVILLKVLMSIGLIYFGIKVLKSLF